MNDLYIMHYGVGHDKGGHSGRYPWGSGKNPKQDLKGIKNRFITNLEQANRYTHQNVQFPNYKQIMKDAGIHTSFGAGMTRNRERVKSVIEAKYNADPEFRRKVKQARLAWTNSGKRSVAEAKEFIKYYKKRNPDAKEIRKAQDFIDSVKDSRLYSLNDDVDFATQYIFDNNVGTNRQRAFVSAGFAVLAGIAAYNLYKEVH